MRFRLTLAIMLVSLCTSTGLRAQYHWKVTHNKSQNEFIYGFTALSTHGTICTAAALKYNNSNHVSRRIFFRSTDEGATWAEQDPGLPQGSGQTGNVFYQLQQIDDLNAIAGADSGLLVKTTDGGEHWQQLKCGSAHFWDFHFLDPNIGIVCEGPHLWTTSNGGGTWNAASVVPSPMWAGGAHAYSADSFRVIVYGGGPVYATSNNWKTFDSTPYAYPISDNEHAVTQFGFAGDTILAFGSFNDTTNGKNVRAGSMIAFSSDAGYHWMDVLDSNKDVGTIWSHSPIDARVVFVGGETRGHILRSMNHGLTWSVDSLLFDTTLFIYQTIKGVSVFPSGRAVAIIAGDQLKASAGYLAVGDPSFNLVKTAELFKCELYPNPLINETRIEWSQSESGYAVFNICDATARELRRVETGIMSAGAHAFTFDRNGLPPGVYFYRLTVGKQCRIGSMVLQ